MIFLTNSFTYFRPQNKFFVKNELFAALENENSCLSGKENKKRMRCM